MLRGLEVGQVDDDDRVDGPGGSSKPEPRAPRCELTAEVPRGQLDRYRGTAGQEGLGKAELTGCVAGTHA